MLYASIESFQRYFDDAKFVVVAQNPKSIRLKGVDIIKHSCTFNTSELDPYFMGIALYNKYNPLRITENGTEIYLDLDLFCVSEPTGLKEFVNSNHQTALQCRTTGNLMDRSGYGSWNPMINSRVPPCSSGIIGFKGDFNFEDRLLKAYKKNLHLKDDFFNEQGSVIYCLQSEILSGRALLLDENSVRYFHPVAYPLELNNHQTQIIHCIGSQKTNYACFRKLSQSGMINDTYRKS